VGRTRAGGDRIMKEKGQQSSRSRAEAMVVVAAPPSLPRPLHYYGGDAAAPALAASRATCMWLWAHSRSRVLLGPSLRLTPQVAQPRVQGAPTMSPRSLDNWGQ